LSFVELYDMECQLISRMREKILGPGIQEEDDRNSDSTSTNLNVQTRNMRMGYIENNLIFRYDYIM